MGTLFVGGGLFGLGATAVYGLSRALRSVGQDTVTFDRGMRNVNSIAQLSERGLKGLSRSVLALGGKTAQAPESLAAGLYDLVSSGFKSRDALKVLESSATAATAGLTDTATSTKAVAGVLNAYHLSAKDAADVSDTLFRTVDRGVITFEELAQNLGPVLPFARGAGIELKDLGAAIATMTKAGIPAANAITFTKNAIVAFNKPSADMQAALKKLGVEGLDDLVKKTGSLQGALQAVVETTDGSQKSISKLFPNIRAASAVLALTGKNARSAGADLKGFSDTHGATARALAQQSQSISYQWQRLKAEASAVKIAIGSAVVDAVKPWMPAVSKAGDDVSRVFLRKDLDLGQKLSEAFRVAKIDLKPVTDQITHSLESVDWGGEFEKGLNAAIPVIAAKGGQLALALVKGLVNGFIHADPLGRLVIGLFAASKLRGLFSRMFAAGETAGLTYSRGFATTATLLGAAPPGRGIPGTVGGGIAGGVGRGRAPTTRPTGLAQDLEALAGGGAAAEGGRLGRAGRVGASFGRIAPFARFAGEAGAAITVIQLGANFLNERERRRSPELGTRLGALSDPGPIQRLIPRSGLDVLRRLLSPERMLEDATGLRGLRSVAGDLRRGRLPSVDHLARGIPVIGGLLGGGAQQEREIRGAKRLSEILDYIQKRRHGITSTTKTEAENLARALSLTRDQRREIERITAIGERAGRGGRGLGIAQGLIDDGKITRREISDTIDELNRLPKGARKAAADTVVSVATELHRQGKIKGSVHDLKVLVEGGVADVGKVSLRGPQSLVDKLGVSMDQLVEAVADPTSQAGQIVADALDSFGEGASAKRIRANLQKQRRIRRSGSGDTKGATQKGQRLGAQRGGKIPGYSRVDDVDIRARRGEALLTPEQHQPWANRVFAFAKSHGVSPWGSLEEMFRATGAHLGGSDAYAQGGFTGPFGSGSGFVPVTNFAREKFGLRATAGRTNHSPLTAQGRPSDHATGMAVDYSNGVLTPQEDAFSAFWKRRLPQVVKQLIWRDRIQTGQGTGAAVSGHQDHVHLGLLRQFAFDEVKMGKLIAAAGAGDLKGLLKGLGLGTGIVDRIERLQIRVQGGVGVQRDLAQGMLRQVERAANRAIERAASAAATVTGQPGAGGNKAANEQLAHKMMRRRWPESEWPALRGLWTGESHFDERADNPQSDAYGIPQALPGSKMASAGPDWHTNPATQIAWGLDYIESVYGSPRKAYATWLGRKPHWYERGGFVDRTVNFVKHAAGGFAPGGFVPEAEAPLSLRYKDNAGKGAGQKKKDKGPVRASTGKTEQEKWGARTPQDQQSYKDHHGGRTKPQELAHEHAQGGKTDQQVAAERKRDAAQRKAAAKRHHARQVKRRHKYDQRRVGELAGKVAPDLEPPPEEMAGVAYYDTLLDQADNSIGRLNALFQRQPAPEVFISRDDALRLPSRQGHRLLDVGPQYDEVADLDAADVRLGQLEHLLGFDYAGRDQIQGAKGIAGAVPRIRRLLARIKKLQERYTRWLGHLRGLVRVIGALRRERGKKKPEKNRVDDLERQARVHARGIGLDPAKAFHVGKRNLLEDSYFLAQFEPKLQADLDKYGKDSENPLTDAENTLKEQLSNYIGGGLTKTGDPLLDTQQGGFGGRLGAILDQTATDETERASLSPGALRAQLLERLPAGGKSAEESRLDALGGVKEAIADLYRSYGSNARFIGSYYYGGIVPRTGPVYAHEGELYLGKQLSDELRRLLGAPPAQASQPPFAGSQRSVHIDKVVNHFDYPPPEPHVWMQQQRALVEAM